MAGEGMAMHANQSLKNNRKLVGKRKDKRFSFISTTKQETTYNLPKASPEKLKLIRQKLIKENKNKRIKLLITISVICAIILLLFIYFIIN